MTGGANWQPKVAPATWSAGVPPSAPLVGSHQRLAQGRQFAGFEVYRAGHILLALPLTLYFFIHIEEIEPKCSIYQNSNSLDFTFSKDYDLFFTLIISK